MDDVFKSAGSVAGGSTLASVISCLCSCAMLGGAITYTVYLTIYAFSNPDPTDCWWVDGMAAGTVSKTIAESAGAALTPVMEPINAHSVFVAWFVWGFWTCVSPCIAAPVFIILGCMQLPQVVMVLGGLLSCGVSCSSLFWIIFGSIWRFGSMGQAVTRDAMGEQPEGVTDEDWFASEQGLKTTTGIQAQSGAFMKVYLIITYVIIGLQLFCCIVGGIMKKMA